MHTPGPWTINHWTTADHGLNSHGLNNNVWSFSAPLIDEDHYQIAAMIDPMKHSLQGDFQGAHICKIIDFKCQDGGKEALANARLIAAAPSILEALEIAQQYVNVFLIRGEDPLVGDQIKDHSFKIIEAIKLAKGDDNKL